MAKKKSKVGPIGSKGTTSRKAMKKHLPGTRASVVSVRKKIADTRTDLARHGVRAITAETRKKRASTKARGSFVRKKK